MRAVGVQPTETHRNLPKPSQTTLTSLVTFLDNPAHKRARLMTPTAKARKALDYLRPRQMQFANLMGSQHSLDALHATLDVLQKSRALIEANNRSRE